MLSNWLQSPYYFMCANLVHPTDDTKVYTPDHPALAGQVVSAMTKLKDTNNQGTFELWEHSISLTHSLEHIIILDGAYCVFGDLSVKAEGQFRLKFTLFKIEE